MLFRRLKIKLFPKLRQGVFLGLCPYKIYICIHNFRLTKPFKVTYVFLLHCYYVTSYLVYIAYYITVKEPMLYSIIKALQQIIISAKAELCGNMCLHTDGIILAADKYAFFFSSRFLIIVKMLSDPVLEKLYCLQSCRSLESYLNQ